MELSLRALTFAGVGSLGTGTCSFNTFCQQAYRNFFADLNHEEGKLRVNIHLCFQLSLIESKHFYFFGAFAVNPSHSIFLGTSFTRKAFFSQKTYVFCLPKSFSCSAGAISKEYRTRARVSRISAHANFWPKHLCRPTRKGSKAVILSAGNGVEGVKRSGMKASGLVKLIVER